MEQPQQLFTSQVDPETQTNLAGASKWARFLGILGFVCIGIMLLVFLLLGNRLSQAFETVMPFDMSAMAGVLIVVLLIVFGIIGVLSYFLIRGANLVQKGIAHNDQLVFNDGLAAYRTYFIIYGILAVISLLFNLISLF